MDLKEDALKLLRVAANGSLATHSSEMPGYPFASWVPFASDDEGAVLFLFSALAQHAKNLQHDSRSSLLVVDAFAPDEDIRRLSLVGKAVKLSGPAAEEARQTYLKRFPDSKRYLELGDFAFWRLEPERARYIGGFGKALWIETGEYRKAAALTAKMPG